MKVAIIGSRRYENTRKIKDTLYQLKKKFEEEEDHSCSLSRILYEMKNRADPDEFVDWDLRLGNYQQYRDAVDDDEAISPMSSGHSSDAE